MLLTLDEVKTHLDKKTTDDDAELIWFMRATVKVVEDYVGCIDTKTFVERHRGGGTSLALRKGPILAVTSIEKWLIAGVVYAPNALLVDADLGLVYRLDGYAFTDGPYRVTYTAGRVEIPENFRQAAKIIVAHVWQTQRGTQITRLPSPEAGGIPSAITYSVPRRALELLRDSRRDKVVVA